LGRLLRAERVQMTVMNVDWVKFRTQLPVSMMPPFLERVIRADLDAVSARDTAAQLRGAATDIVVRLRSAAPGARRILLQRHVQGQIAKVIGLSSPESVEPRQPLFDLGLDSLTAIELKNLLQSSLKCTLTPTLLFDYPTLEALLNYLAEIVLPDENVKTDGAEREVFATKPEIERRVDQLSESEAEALLIKAVDGLSSGARI